ncbi:polyprenyl synthetase family protein [Streptomyces sp. NPDC046887]|uniref:polyprenyl synthetase family protein n=1 Tax=Streptomyces sp. NPDC046887 TaxID=3155472 RepID=UPI0033FCA545
MLAPRTTPAGAGAAHAPPAPPAPPVIEAVRAVEHFLAGHLAGKRRGAGAVDPVFAEELVTRVTAFVGRGGKRLRCAFAWCGWRAAGGGTDLGVRPAAGGGADRDGSPADGGGTEPGVRAVDGGDDRRADGGGADRVGQPADGGGAADVVRIGAALELLQACALIHDDVMDGSPRRRGAPAVHTEFARLHRTGRLLGPPEAFAASAAILAGDLVLAWADDLLAETALGSPHGAALQREWAAMRGEMVAGQYLDIRAQAEGSSSPADAVRIACLKSALYTVERPLALGAAAAGADPATTAALRSAGRCAGLAFQLRDDLLGAFGDPAATGKPADEDLRGRKLTYLLAVAARSAAGSGDAAAAEALAAGGASAGARDVARMRAAIERTGARAAVEARIAELAGASLRHFAGSGAEEPVRREFAALVERAAGVRVPSAGRPRTEDV